MQHWRTIAKISPVFEIAGYMALDVACREGRPASPNVSNTTERNIVKYAGIKVVDTLIHVKAMRLTALSNNELELRSHDFH